MAVVGRPHLVLDLRVACLQLVQQSLVERGRQEVVDDDVAVAVEPVLLTVGQARAGEDFGRVHGHSTTRYDVRALCL